jgi:putative FmdB family regulatory protein
MPHYDYRCEDCKRRSAIYSARFLSAEEMAAKCPHCGSERMRRLIGRIGLLRSEESRLDDLSDASGFGDLDENDPQALGRFMRKMSAEAGEELGPEFDEVVGRLESGEHPEEIERSMPELAGGGEGGEGGEGDLGGDDLGGDDLGGGDLGGGGDDF